MKEKLAEIGKITGGRTLDGLLDDLLTRSTMCSTGVVTGAIHNALTTLVNNGIPEQLLSFVHVEYSRPAEYVDFNYDVRLLSFDLLNPNPNPPPSLPLFSIAQVFKANAHVQTLEHVEDTNEYLNRLVSYAEQNRSTDRLDAYNLIFTQVVGELVENGGDIEDVRDGNNGGVFVVVNVNDLRLEMLWNYHVINSLRNALETALAVSHKTMVIAKAAYLQNPGA